MFSLRSSAYLCDLCVEKAISAQRSQRYAEDRRERLQNWQGVLFVRAAISLEVRVVKNFAVVVIKVIITPLI